MSALLSLLTDKVFGPLIGLALAVLVGTGAYFVGHYRGADAVQAQWDTAKAAQAAREDGVAKTVASLSTQLVAEMQTRLDNLEHEQTDAIDAARKADTAPVDRGCSDVRRGIPSGVVRAIGKIR